MTSTWDPLRVKAQLRLTTQRLGQLQDKKDSLAQITKRDIATLLQQHNVGLARAKVQNLIKEDAATDLLEVLEMYCGIILEHFGELEASEPRLRPASVEAASSIIHAALRTESRDLNIVRDMLIKRLGPDFTRSAIGNTDQYVSPRVIRAMKPAISAASLDTYMVKIAQSYGFKWVPDMTMDEKIDLLSGMFDTSDPAQVLDISRLRHIASSGLPDHPPSLRPRVWRVLLSTLPVDKSKWATEPRKQRESYYELVRRLLSPYAHDTPATSPLSSPDQTLLGLSEALRRIPLALYSELEEEPELFNICPLHDVAGSTIYSKLAGVLDRRLAIIHAGVTEKESIHGTPEIRLEVDEEDGVNNDAFSPSLNPSLQRSSTPTTTTLHPSKTYRSTGAHPKHISALLRLLLVHSSLNPANRAPYVASLLVPIYNVLNRELEPSELAHAEADTFWLFEALIGEVAELEDEEGENLWMRRFSERLAWADPELAADLQAKDLDPCLPHYSHRWLAPVLTNTLPLTVVLMIWDALFAQPSALRGQNPKLEYLLDVCTALLVRARSQIFRLGRSGPKSPSLWNDEFASIPSASSSRSWELGDAFMEGLTMLSEYPIEKMGGVERILQVANDLTSRRIEEAKVPKPDNLSLTAVLRQTVWGSASSSAAPKDNTSEDSSSEDDMTVSLQGDRPVDDGDETETPGLASRLRTAVWKGISNQTAMEPPVSPLSPSAPVILHSKASLQDQKSDSSSHSQLDSISQPATSSIWGYAAKLKDSDMAARLSKVSTNLTVKAIGAWHARQDSTGESVASSIPNAREASTTTASLTLTVPTPHLGISRRDDAIKVGPYEFPARPAYFRPPRDSWAPQSSPSSSVTGLDSPESAVSVQSVSDSVTEASRRLHVSLASLSGLHETTQKPSTSKGGPRPLLLNSTTLITSPSQGPTLSGSNIVIPNRDVGQWADVLRKKVQMPRHRDSQSSVSSFSPDVLRGRRAEDWDSDTSISRVVPLNRARVSPHAPSFRSSRYRQSSVSSRSEGELLSPPTSIHPSRKALPLTTPAPSGISASFVPHLRASGSSDGSGSAKSWEHVDRLDSPATLPSSPPLETPVTIACVTSTADEVSNRDSRASATLSEQAIGPLKSTISNSKRPSLKIDPTPVHEQLQYAEGNSDSSASPVVLRTPTRLARSRRFQHRPPNLRVRGSARTQSGSGQDDPSSLGAPEQSLSMDLMTTPRAVEFPMSASPVEARSPRRLRKTSTETKTTKDSQSTRPRKVSTDHRRTESAANEGDDEGYDDLLSAYESEEGFGQSLTD